MFLWVSLFAGRMESALIGLQWPFVVTHARVVVVALRRSRCA